MLSFLVLNPQIFCRDDLCIQWLIEVVLVDLNGEGGVVQMSFVHGNGRSWPLVSDSSGRWLRAVPKSGF